MSLAAVAGSVLSLAAGLASPLEPTAEWLMEWTPLPIADFLLSHVGAVARPAALLGSFAIALLVGGMGGALYGLAGCRHRLVGTGLAAALAAAWFLGAVPGADPHPAYLLMALYLALLAVLSTVPRPVEGRRQFLQQSAAVLGGAAALLGLFALDPLLRTLGATRLFAFRAPTGLAVSGITPLITDPSDFYIMDKMLQYPEIGPPSWRLIIDGGVKPLSLDYASLRAMPAEHRYITMECVDNPVGGPLIGTALWSGVPLETILRRAGARGDVLVFHSVNGYAETISRAEAIASRALVAYGMNGAVLPVAHGYPARVVVPGVYGFKSVKWLDRIEVASTDSGGDWKLHGWSTSGQIHTTTRIDLARRTGSEITVAGIAFAGRRGISAVQLRVNGGPWKEATLGPRLSRQTWVQWAMRLRGPAPARIEVRAVDGGGVVQDPRVRAPYPDGASGWSSLTV